MFSRSYETYMHGKLLTVSDFFLDCFVLEQRSSYQSFVISLIYLPKTEALENRRFVQISMKTLSNNWRLASNVISSNLCQDMRKMFLVSVKRSPNWTFRTELILHFNTLWHETCVRCSLNHWALMRIRVVQWYSNWFRSLVLKLQHLQTVRKKLLSNKCLQMWGT